MPLKFGMSKAFAIAFGVMTASAIGGMFTMIILYKTETHNMTMTPPPTQPSTTLPPPPVMRLPKTLVPQKYDIVLWVHLYTKIIVEGNMTNPNITTPNQTMLFTGNSTVHFHCVQKTMSIFLNSKDLTVDAPVVRNKDTNKNVPVSGLKHYDDESDFLEVQLKEPLEAGGNYSLLLAFRGDVSDNLEGLYVSRYTDEASPGEQKLFIAVTNLQPTDARRVFPCFDEPDMKAVFQLTVIHRPETKVVANAKALDGWKYTWFEPTPKMSTYLFAFMVVDNTFDFTTSSTYARPEAVGAGHTNYATDITGRILDFYEGEFEIKYRMRKLDQIALPDLYPAGMENWGMITYQEGVLLYEEGVSSLLHKEEIATVIAHELAHQWFGNLVTMKWWNDLWLNEGFATYFSYFAVDKVEPTFNIVSFISPDSLASSHPLSPAPGDIQTTDEILGLFDSISYSKGAMVLRMLANRVGQNIFDKGINAENENRAPGETARSANSIAEFMGPWTKQSGYPVVSINTTDGRVFQKQFLFNSSKGEWILANINCTGYYRVNYNPENWERLLTQLQINRHRIPLMNRGQLVDDAFNLARAKLVNVTLALNSTLFLKNETEFLPWESAVMNLEYFILMFDRSEVYGPMQAYLQEQVKELYNSFINYTNSATVPLHDHSLQHTQLLAIQLACSSGLPECIEMATEKYADWMESNTTNSIHPNLRSVIYCQAVAAGGKEEWEFAWDRYLTSSDTSEKEQLRRALSCTRKIWLLSRYLDYTLDPEKIRLMDVASTINYIAQNAAGQALAWNFIRAHWNYVSQGDATALIAGVTRRFSTQFELEELTRFEADYDLRGAYRVVSLAIEQTRVNIQWVKENKDVVLQWFEQRTPPAV
uniref:Aminopeptidase n=1 Tax=Amphilophus citrinellus TaxID=61819 RepID=A0A3Q0RHY4_AMPCI